MIFNLTSPMGIEIDSGPFTVTFMYCEDYSNDYVEWDKVTVDKGGTATPLKGNPPRDYTDQTWLIKTFVGWNSQQYEDKAEEGVLENIQADKVVYAAYYI